MAVVNTTWNGQASRFDDAQWQASCLVDRGQEFNTAKTRYAVPVKEPNGDVNSNAVHAAAAVLAGARGGVQAPPAAKKQAARKLVRLYALLDESPPESLTRLAG